MRTEGDSALPAGQSLVHVDVEPGEEGALRLLQFDDRAHVLLSEELKHLYTVGVYEACRVFESVVVKITCRSPMGQALAPWDYSV